VAGVLNGTLIAGQQTAPELAQALLAIGIGPVVGDYELVELGMADRDLLLPALLSADHGARPR
jgi:hypothetical protein